MIWLSLQLLLITKNNEFISNNTDNNNVTLLIFNLILIWYKRNKAKEYFVKYWCLGTKFFVKIALTKDRLYKHTWKAHKQDVFGVCPKVSPCWVTNGDFDLNDITFNINSFHVALYKKNISNWWPFVYTRTNWGITIWVGYRRNSN